MQKLSLSRILKSLCLGLLIITIGYFAYSRLSVAAAHEIADQTDESHRHLAKDWDHEKLTHEAFEWHEAQRKRLASEQAKTTTFRTEAVTSDTSEMFLIQDDGTIITNQNPFDLTGKSVLFTPSGAGYTINSSNASIDTSFGGKLDLTASPAVNPKSIQDSRVELGDDAYIAQTLGFNFNYFGTLYSTVYVTSNGNLVFKPANADSGFDLDAVDTSNSLTTFRVGSPRICPYWHDLDARTATTGGANGVYLRRDSDRVVVTYNNVRDFPNSSTDNGIHTFQVTLFSDGRILFTYQSIQLTTNALVGISPGNSSQTVTLVDLSVPTTSFTNAPIAEYFSTTSRVDEVAAIQAFYDAHPGRDDWDFAYFLTDFDYNLVGGAFAYYAPLRNSISGIGESTFDTSTAQTFGKTRIQGWLNLSNIVSKYPEYPTTRLLGANNSLSVMGQEQGHRWMAYVQYPGATPNLLLGRDDEHWSFFYSIESALSHPAARRSSSSEGNVWRENSNGTFTSVNLIDGYSRLDHYLMGLRPASDVNDTFVITNPNASGFTRTSGPRPNVTATGGKQIITINEIIQANGARVPNVSVAPKKFRTAFILLSRFGSPASLTTINKLNRFRLTWESYFAHSTDYLGSLSTSIDDPNATRIIAAVSAASYTHVLTPGGIASVFGQGMTSGDSEAAVTQPLPTTLAGTQVLLNGIPAPLLYASPTQINLEIPTNISATTPALNVQSGTVTLEVLSGGQLVRACAVQVAPALPAIFAVNQQGTGTAAALDAVTFAPAPFNATLPNGQPNIIALYGTGLGADATDVDGNINSSVQVTFNGNPVTVQYAGRAPGYAGLNQINFFLPSGVTSGTYSVVVSRNGFASNTATITIK